MGFMLPFLFQLPGEIYSVSIFPPLQERQREEVHLQSLVQGWRHHTYLRSHPTNHRDGVAASATPGYEVKLL